MIGGLLPRSGCLFETDRFGIYGEKRMKTSGLNYDSKPGYVKEFTDYSLKVIESSLEQKAGLSG